LKKNFIVAFNMDEKKILQLFSGLYYKAFQSINCETESSLFWRPFLARYFLARFWHAYFWRAFGTHTFGALLALTLRALLTLTPAFWRFWRAFGTHTLSFLARFWCKCYALARFWTRQGTLTEGDGSVRLTSSLR
jgi:hypothetical protein